MIAPKYISDYYLDVSKDDDGRVVQTNVYIGPLYKLRIKGGPELFGRYAIIIIIATILSCVAFLGGLSFYNTLSRIWYTSIPYAASAAGLMMTVASILKLKKPDVPMERITKERSIDRLKSGSTISICFSAVSLVGAIVAVFSGRVVMDLGNVLYFMTLAFQELGMVIVLIISLRFDSVEEENPNAALYPKEDDAATK